MIEGTWAKVEMLGHRQVVGQLSEETVAGAAMLRIDIPSDPPGVILAAPSSLYAITPCSEEWARGHFAAPKELDTGSADIDDWDDDGDEDSE